MFNTFNPYYQRPMQPMQPIQPMTPMQNMQEQYQRPMGLQGKSVDNIDVVKAMDIPLDGTISYFPLTDGSAIVTKQLMQDGTSKTLIYKQAEAEQIKTPKYITEDDLNEITKKYDNSTLKEDIKNMKRNINDMKDIIDELKERNDVK